MCVVTAVLADWAHRWSSCWNRLHGGGGVTIPGVFPGDVALRDVGCTGGRWVKDRVRLDSSNLSDSNESSVLGCVWSATKQRSQQIVSGSVSSNICVQ